MCLLYYTEEVMFTGMESNQSIVHISITDMVADKSGMEPLKPTKNS